MPTILFSGYKAVIWCLQSYFSAK